jgi:CubicO group peptidase (beta-lactamase class C family)
MADVERRLKGVVEDAMTKYSVPGVSVGVVHDGGDHYISAGTTSVEFGVDVDEHTMFQIGSTTKTYTGAVLMMLVEEGKVDLDAPVTKYLPKFSLPDKAALKALRVWHLTTHTGGFVGDYFDDTGRGADAIKKIVARMRTKTPQLTPVAKLWSYNNSAFYALGRLIEEVTGEAYENVVNARILQPLGMEETFWFPEDVITRKTAIGHVMNAAKEPRHARPWGLVRSANPAGGIVSTASDQLKYARFLLDGGKTADGTRLLKAATLKAMQTTRFKIGWGLADNMGITWMLDSYPGGVKVAKHGGSINGHMSEFLFVPSKGFAITVLTNGQRGHELGTDVLAWSLKELLGLAKPAPATKAIGAKAAAEYAGRYQVTFGDYVVTPENGGLLVSLEPKKELLEADPDLVAQLPPPVPIKFVGKDRAVVVGDYVAGSKVEFFRDDDGNVEWLRFGGRINRKTE